MSEIINIPTTLEEFTPAWLTKALREEGVIGDEAIVSSLTKTRIGEDEGFTGGALIRCQLAYASPAESAPHSLISKLSPADSELRAVFKNVNRREVSFYTKFAVQDNLPVPHCYHGNFDEETGASILLLQDLDQHRMISFANGCEPRDARHAVHALGMIHAQLWNDPRIQILSGVDILNDFPFAELWVQYPQAIAELLPEFAIPTQFFATGDAVAKNISSLLSYLMETAPITCIHRDIHVDNIIFGVNEDDKPALILDWQSVGKGRGVYDIAYFLISSVPIEIRRQTERTLLREYHAQLMRYGITDYSFEKCWFDYLLAVVGKLLVTVIATVLIDNSSPFKQTWRQTDLERLLGFCEEHAIDELLASI